MDLISCFRSHQSFRGISVLPAFGVTSFSAVNRFRSTTSLRFGFPASPFRRAPNFSFETHAKKSKKKTSIVEPKPNKFVDLEDDEEEEQVLPEDIQDELLMDDDDDFYLDEDEFDEIEDELYAGDGGGGGGIKLAGTLWDKEALSLAEKVCESFDGELGIYAFKTLANSTIQVRIERLTNNFGSPTMYARYMNEEAETEGDGIFRLVSFDVEARSCIWGIADIRVNREKAGKGRPLSKKQREWRLETAFESLRLVRLHSEC